MSEFWYNVVPLAVVGCIVFFMFGMGQLMFNDMEKSQTRYEQCIAADMQWVEGNCVKCFGDSCTGLVCIRTRLAESMSLIAVTSYLKRAA